MLSFFFKVMIVFFSLFSFGYASPCDPIALKSELIKLKLDPNIKTNAELLQQVEFRYGQYAKSFLTRENVFLGKDLDGSIDEETLEWLNDIVWDKNNPFTVYLYVAGDLLTLDSIDFFVDFMSGAINSKRRTVPIFQYNNSLIEFKKLLDPQNEYILKESFKRLYPKENNEIHEHLLNLFTFYLRKLDVDDLKIGFSDFSVDSSPTILVAGHGLDGVPAYGFGDVHGFENTMITTENIVEKLIDMDLPKKATIKLTGCFSACKKSKTSYTVKEIESLFYQHKLITIYDDNQTKSFFSVFIEEIKKQMPTFSGRVDAYIGELSSEMDDGVLKIDGKRTTSYFVRIMSSSGERVKLKRSEARISKTF